MGAMNREILTSILGDLPGMTRSGDDFVVGDEQIVSFHLGDAQRSSVVRDVQGGALRDEFLRFTTKESEQTYYLPYAELHVVSAIPARKQGRAGFA